MPLIETRGAASAQGFGEFAQSAAPVYIEDVFSTYLYTGNGTSQTITNGIDLSGKGGLVWIKGRSLGYSHYLANTNRGASKYLATNRSDAENYNGNYTDTLTSFNSNGFSLGADSLGSVNTSGDTYASWTFRKQAKFFDVVTFTSNGSGGGTFSHSLGSTPGCVIIKSTSAANSWLVYHRSTGVSKYLELQSTAAEQTGTNWISVSSTSVTVDSGWLGNNRSMVAYLFAHDAGGFGLSGSDNVISCGSFTTDGSGNATVSLGYEPQWVMTKCSSTVTSGWNIVDSMRGNATLNGTVNTEQTLRAESSNAESSTYGIANPTSTGFVASGWAASITFIYIAIRRGPMKVPTSGTSVFDPETYTGNATARSISGLGFPPDLVFPKIRDNGGGFNGTLTDRLRGVTNYLVANDTAAEATNAQYVTVLGQDGFSLGTGADVNRNTSTFVSWNFRRAPGFFDVVCYAGTGSNLTVAHNLTVAPQLIIIKNRTNSWSWNVGYNFGVSSYDFLTLDNNDPGTGNSYNSHYTAAPTATQFFLATNVRVNQSSANFVAYLFATVAGVSKVGSYTGSGTTKQIDCGFTGGARFVLIKRTDSTGDWYVYDSARGIVSGNDPYLFLNSTAAEVTNTDYVDTYSAGFELSSTAPAGLNANGGTYIFLAIA
jgi:hypothetical protein